MSGRNADKLRGIYKIELKVICVCKNSIPTHRTSRIYKIELKEWFEHGWDYSQSTVRIYKIELKENKSMGCEY